MARARRHAGRKPWSGEVLDGVTRDCLLGQALVPPAPTAGGKLTETVRLTIERLKDRRQIRPTPNLNHRCVAVVPAARERFAHGHTPGFRGLQRHVTFGACRPDFGLPEFGTLVGNALCGEARPLCSRDPRNHKISEHQQVHARAQEAVQCFLRPADNRLVLIERSVQQDGHAGDLSKRIDQTVVQRI